MDRIDSFILANHEHLTTADLAEELGESVQIVAKRAIKLGVVPIKRRQQIYNYIRDNPHYTGVKLSQKLGIRVSELIKYAKEIGAIIPEEKEPQPSSPFSYATIEFLIENSYTLITGEIKPPNKGFKDKYNQSGSPLLDEVWGIETTKRETPTAKDARIK